MEIRMKRLALAFGITATLSAPAMAVTLNVILPMFSFPEDTVVPSTKGNDDKASAPVVQTKD
jgi:hypothetical protein